MSGFGRVEGLVGSRVYLVREGLVTVSLVIVSESLCRFGRCVGGEFPRYFGTKGTCFLFTKTIALIPFIMIRTQLLRTHPESGVAFS